MDATVIEGFVEEINRWHKGLTQKQCHRVNKNVIGWFNEQRKRHDDHVDFVLDRGLNHGVVAFPKMVEEEEAEMESAAEEERETNGWLRSLGYDVSDGDDDYDY